MVLGRARGLLLRFARRRLLVMMCGAALLIPSAWANLTGRFDAWWAQGLGLIAGATGVALIWTGLTGSRPDWIDKS